MCMYLIIFSTLFVVLFVSVLGVNDGNFVYTLDDPYIHLDLAYNLLDGNYGVNINEASSPSSSIAWAFVLVGMYTVFLTVVPLELIPILLNFAFSIGVIYYVAKLMLYLFPKYDVAVHISMLYVLIACNLLGLAFNGMEHSFQIFSVSMIIYYYAVNKNSSVLYIILALAPLIRYENMAVSFPLLALLAYEGNIKKSVVAFASSLGVIVAFSLFLYGLELGFLPSSVMVKSGAFQDSLINVLIAKITENTTSVITVPLLLLLTLITAIKNKDNRALVISLIASETLHLLFGRTGWFFRYDIYMALYIFLILVYINKEIIGSALESIGKSEIKMYGVVIAFGIFIITINPLSSLAQLLTWQASNNIYSQQYYMSEIASEYNASVGVNDLGLVTYKNDNYVLDLFGLASQEAMKARLSGNTELMQELVVANNVGLVMIYDEWFTKRPKEWVKIGELHLKEPRVSPVKKMVSFYSTSHDNKKEIELLKRFSKVDLLVRESSNTRHPL